MSSSICVVMRSEPKLINSNFTYTPYILFEFLINKNFYSGDLFLKNYTVFESILISDDFSEYNFHLPIFNKKVLIKILELNFYLGKKYKILKSYINNFEDKKCEFRFIRLECNFKNKIYLLFSLLNYCKKYKLCI